jgi:lysylphosphatidylglycerol synthetase-like protein (DUF2156 family)
MTYIPITKNFQLGWVEFVSIVLLIFGFILALMSGSAVIYYIVAFLTGIFFGRLWHNTKNTFQFKYFLMVTFFMLGFIAGNIITRYGNPRITIFVYFIGILISYYINRKGLIKAVDY